MTYPLHHPLCIQRNTDLHICDLSRFPVTFMWSFWHQEELPILSRYLFVGEFTLLSLSFFKSLAILFFYLFFSFFFSFCVHFEIFKPLLRFLLIIDIFFLNALKFHRFKHFKNWKSILAFVKYMGYFSKREWGDFFKFL